MGDLRDPSKVALEALLDTLVATQLELEPLQTAKPLGASGTESDTIAVAYAMLRSAIIDLRGIIEQTDGMAAR